MIRQFIDEDISALSKIYNYYIEHTNITFELKPLSDSEFLERIHKIMRDYPFFVYEENEHILGYAYFDHFNTREAYDYTVDVSIYLDHENKSQGIGSKLMEELINYANLHYYKLVSLITDDNEISKTFHEKYGFEYIGCLKEVGYKFHKWHDVSFYCKTIENFKKDKLL